MSESPKNFTDTPRAECGSIAQRIARVLAICAALGGGCATAQNTGAKALETDEWTAEWVDEPNAETAVSEVTEHAKAEKDTKPEWVNGPIGFEKDGFVYGVGCDKINGDLSKAKSRSEGMAATNLARFIKGNPKLVQVTLKAAEVVKREIVEERDELCTLMKMEK